MTDDSRDEEILELILAKWVIYGGGSLTLIWLWIAIILTTFF